MFPKEFYILPEELFRLGNSANPKLSNVRSRDVDTIEINGITVIRANWGEIWDRHDLKSLNLL